MLITLKELLFEAEKKEIAYGSFNVGNFESALAIIEAGEALNMPVILSPGPGLESFIKLEDSMAICHFLAKNAKVDVCIHLDHCRDLDFMKKALDLGATSVMFDGSHEDFALNIELTKQVVAMAKNYGASIEAELGKVATSTVGHPELEQASNITELTDPDEAAKFVELTGIDALAVAIGTIHGVYTSEPDLNIPLIKTIKDRTGIPLVMHGGSGVGPTDIKNAIKNGIRKINYYTYANMAAGQAAKEYCEVNNPVFFHDLSALGVKVMKDDFKKTMELFAGR